MTGLGAKASSLAALCLHFKITIFGFGSPTSLIGYGRGESEGPAPKGPFRKFPKLLVLAAWDLQPQRTGRSGVRLLGSFEPTREDSASRAEGGAEEDKGSSSPGGADPKRQSQPGLSSSQRPESLHSASAAPSNLHPSGSSGATCPHLKA